MIQLRSALRLSGGTQQNKVPETQPEGPELGAVMSSKRPTGLPPSNTFMIDYRSQMWNICIDMFVSFDYIQRST
jgi:hypothetical protein